MKQLLQDLRTGDTMLAEVPVPVPGRGQVLIRTSRSLISAGTERMLIDFGKAGWIEKARQQPDKVRQVLEKIRTDGLLPTIEAVRNKLDQPLALGYCNVGEVVEIGPGVTGFAVGDRVASNGKHAEYVAVPVNLCATVPDAVSDEAAAFTVLGAIALQGIRLAQPTLGEAVVVSGLGLIGLLTVQLLRAHGCRVLGLDFDTQRLALAREFGAETVDLGGGADAVGAAMGFSRGRGVDAVIVTASTQSSEPIHQAAQMCRKRGRIVLVGVIGLELSRADFYEKELTFQVSCSYGPGRYDPNYEEKGQDYPLGFVRWTEQRNFEAVLDMLADGHLNVAPLISHRFALDRAQEAYALLASGQPSLGIVLQYPAGDRHAAWAPVVALPRSAPAKAASPAIGVIGAGNYASAVLVPAFVRAGAGPRTIVSAQGVTAAHLARKFAFAQAATAAEAVLDDAATDVVVIATRHDTHAEYVVRAIEAGKHVFVEKPLAVRLEEVERIEAALRSRPECLLMVGFNRRFAPHVARMKQLLAGVPGPKAFVVTVNAGALPPTHWMLDPQIGGGRLVGEGCHFVDLLRCLVGAEVESFEVAAMRAATRDTATVLLRFADGSIGTLHYLANGSKAFPKERVEVFASGRVLQLDNFRRLTGYGWPGFRGMWLWRQDKGQNACVAAFLDAVRAGNPSPIPPEELLEVARVSIRIEEALR